MVTGKKTPIFALETVDFLCDVNLVTGKQKKPVFALENVDFFIRRNTCFVSTPGNWILGTPKSSY